MKSSVSSVIFLIMIGYSFADFLSLGDALTDMVSGAINQVMKLSTRLFHEALYPILSAIPDFYNVFPPRMDPEEAGITARGAIEYIYKTFDLPLDDDLLQEWVDDFRRFAVSGFSSEGFVLCFSAMLGEFLTYENQMTLTSALGLATNFVNALLEILGFDEEEKMRDIFVVSPYHAALAKANVKFMKSVNPTITKDEMDRILKVFYEELHRHLN